MLTLKEYEACLRVKRFIDGHDESEIISRLMGDNKYVPLIIESDGTDPIKYYSTSASHFCPNNYILKNKGPKMA